VEHAQLGLVRHEREAEGGAEKAGARVGHDSCLKFLDLTAFDVKHVRARLQGATGEPGDGCPASFRMGSIVPPGVGIAGVGDAPRSRESPWHIGCWGNASFEGGAP